MLTAQLYPKNDKTGLLIENLIGACKESAPLGYNPFIR